MKGYARLELIPNAQTDSVHLDVMRNGAIVATIASIDCNLTNTINIGFPLYESVMIPGDVNLQMRRNNVNAAVAIEFYGADYTGNRFEPMD